MSGTNGSHLIAAILAVLLWSTSFVGTKIAYESFAPLTLGACRFVIAFLALGGVLAITREFILPTPRDTGILAASGLLGITLYFSMENIGVSLTSASNAALIVASYPAITILLERIVYGIPVSRIKGLGVALAMIGVYLLSGAGRQGPENGQLAGNLILAATGIVWALYNFATRAVINKYPAVTVSFFQTAIGTAAFIPLACLESDSWKIPDTEGFLMLLYLGVFCSVAAFMLYNHGLKKLSAGTAVTLMNLVPVFGVLLSVLVLDENVRADQLIGGAIVIGGVFLSVKPPRASRTAMECR